VVNVTTREQAIIIATQSTTVLVLAPLDLELSWPPPQ